MRQPDNAVFVGREREKGAFRELLASPTSGSGELRLLHISGPSGIGKTSLLRELHRIAHDDGVKSLLVDFRFLAPSPQSLFNGLASALELTGASSGPTPAEIVQALASFGVILIDSADGLSEIESWWREAFLPQLRGSTKIVIASQKTLPPRWMTDPVWKARTRMVELGTLSSLESRELLRSRKLTDDQAEPIVEFSRGYPLALSLAVETLGDRQTRIDPRSVQSSVIESLVDIFLSQVPSEAHRQAIESAAVVRFLPESLLEALVREGTLVQPSAGSVRELYRWLGSLSLFERGADGLVLHDQLREFIYSNLIKSSNRGETSSFVTAVHDGARRYYTSKIEKQGADETTLFDLIYLHRHKPQIASSFSWENPGGYELDIFRPEDLPVLEQAVLRHEGKRSAEILSQWAHMHPEGITVCREGGCAAGFLVALNRRDILNGPGSVADPVLSATVPSVEKWLKKNPGKEVLLFRSWMALDGYQKISPLQSLIFVQIVLRYLQTPDLGLSLLVCADDPRWIESLGYGNIRRDSALDFEIEGRKYSVFTHDWVIEPPVVWLAELAKKELPDAIAGRARTGQDTRLSGDHKIKRTSGSVGGAVPRTSNKTPSQTEAGLGPTIDLPAGFVRDVLKNYLKQDVLERHPYTGTRAVRELLQTQNHLSKAKAVRALIEEALDLMKKDPKERGFAEAVFHTYVEPAPSQEIAAEIMGLPFSTYRRHLASGLARLEEILRWKERS